MAPSEWLGTSRAPSSHYVESQLARIPIFVGSLLLGNQSFEVIYKKFLITFVRQALLNIFFSNFLFSVDIFICSTKYFWRRLARTTFLWENFPVE